MLVRHPGAPTGELGNYYFSYGTKEVTVVVADPAEPEWAEPESLEEPEPLEEPDDDDACQSFVVEYATWALDSLDYVLTGWMARNALRVVQMSLGLIFLWFGALKFVPGLSPAEDLVRTTVNELFLLLGVGVPATFALILLAAWEVAVGIGFLLDRYRRAIVWMLFLHMSGTALPLFLLPDVVWTQFPHGLTLEGQYIVKNLALVGGAMVIGATVRGGGLSASDGDNGPEPGRFEFDSCPPDDGDDAGHEFPVMMG